MPYSYASKKPYSSTRSKARRRSYAPKKVTKSYIAKVARQVTNRAKPTKEWREALASTLNSAAPPGSGVYYSSIIGMVPGDHKDDRTSNRIYISGVKVNVSFHNDLVTAPRYVRVALVHTVNRDGDLLDLTGFTDWFTDSAYANRTINNLSTDAVSPWNLDIVRPLYDKVCKLGKDGDATSACHMDFYIPIRKYVQFIDNGSTLALSSGQYYLVFLLSEPSNTPSATVVSFNYMARVFFKDA